MSVLLLLFSHKLTDDQISDAKEVVKCTDFKYLPNDLQEIWSNVDPDSESIDKLDQIKAYVILNTIPGDYILIQGEFGYTYNMVNFALNNKLIPIYSTTKREVSEEVIEGVVRKTLQFKHVRFRKYL